MVMNAVSPVSTASDIQMDYMKLLVTELRNQNPLEPMDNSQMASQLAQFSQLQQLESMDSNFANILAVTERTYANTLIGKQVSFMAETPGGTKELTNGMVDEVIPNDGGDILLTIGNHTATLRDIISVKN
jgi:flagellar basal-body rod modification protein FlgD